MAGDNLKQPSNKRPPPSSSSSDRKSRWQSSSPSAAGKPSASDSKPPTTTTTAKPSSNKSTPKHAPNPSPSHPPSSFAPPPPPPQPTYGFHKLDRRTIVLADGTVRSYFALPPDYQDFPPHPMGRFMPGAGPPELSRLPPLGPMSPDGFRHPEDPFGPEDSLKRKFGFREDIERDMELRGRDEFARQKQQVLQYGNAGASLGTGTSSPFRRDDEEYRSSKYMKIGGGGFDGGYAGMRQDIHVDPAVMKAFLHFVKLIYENPNQRKNYLENGKHGPLQCLACGRSSKDFPDVHALIMHSYNSDNADLRVDHLGLHKALCALMGWNYLRAPDNSRAYQFLPADEAAANQDDLIIWPPTVIIHNTNTGKGKDGRMEGLGNKAMDGKIRARGISGGKSKSLYNREGHLGITLVRFGSDQSGLKEAMQLAEQLEKEHHGRRDWARVSMAIGRDDENNPNLVIVDERTGERKRVFYGYLATASDIDKVDFETRKKVVIESKHERLLPSK